LISDAAAAAANTVTWPAARPMWRVYDAAYASTAFNPSSKSARFRPIRDSGAVVPTAYGGEDATIALTESVVRAEDFPGPSSVLLVVTLARYEIAQLVCDQDLTLVQLNGTGLRKLRLNRGRVIDTDKSRYPHTARLAQQLYDHGPRAQGLLWTSHQADHGDAVILWETRLGTARFHVVEGPYSLDHGHGLRLVRKVAEQCGVLVQT
jgi:hypothetical protein